MKTISAIASCATQITPDGSRLEEQGLTNSKTFFGYVSNVGDVMPPCRPNRPVVPERTKPNPVGRTGQSSLKPNLAWPDRQVVSEKSKPNLG